MLSRLNEPITFKRPSLPKRRRPRAAEESVARKRSRRSLVGLDIEPGQVVAAEVRVNGALEVTRAIGVPIPPEVVRDGEVADAERLTAALQELFDHSKLDRRVRIGIANQRIVVRKLELPPISDPKELATAVRFQAQDEIPMPLGSVVMDFHSLGVVETAAGPRQQIVLVAARRDMVERVLQAARAAGLRPEGVDLSAFAMIRALRPASAPGDERVLYLAIGGLTNLAIAEGPVCQFTRVIGGGVEQIVADLAERCAVPISDARQLLGRVRIAEPVETDDRDEPASEALAAAAAAGAGDAHESAGDDGVGASGDAANAAQRAVDNATAARSVLTDGIRRIAAEVRNSLDFHRSQEGGYGVTRAVLCGPATDIPGFDSALAAELGLPVGSGAVARVGSAGAGDVPDSRLTVAAGLALERGLG